MLKSNLAIAEEYTRLIKIYSRTNLVHCPSHTCENYEKCLPTHAESYRKYGVTAKGDARYQCKACRKVFSVGKPNRRHKRKDLARKVLRSLMNGMTLSAISRVQDVHIEDVYRKIDFLNEQCLQFAAEREKALPECFAGGQPHFATDTQMLMVNWSDSGIRKQVEVRHTCTVHRDTGFVVAATTDVDPDISGFVQEEMAAIRGELSLPKSMRDNSRIWFASDYVDYIRRRYDSIRKEHHENASGMSHEDLLLRSGRVFQDVADYAHVMLVKSKIGSDYNRLNLTTDRDSGLSQAVCAIYKDLIAENVVSVADVTIDKNTTNDYRLRLVQDGRQNLETVQMHMAVSEFVADQSMDDYFNSTNHAVQYLLSDLKKSQGSDEFRRILMEDGFSYPFHFVNEPNKRVFFRTDPRLLSDAQLAQFIIKSGTHAVDTYHARARYKIMGFERGLSPGRAGGLYYYKQYYDPTRVMKIVNILRFAHNYMDLLNDKVSPATKLGLTKGFIYDRDLT